MTERIAVLGLGYVGLPLMIGMAKKFDGVVGFDIDSRRVAALKAAHDWTGEVEAQALQTTTGLLTDKADDMLDCSLFIVTVPTPIDQAKRPDLAPVLSACRIMAEVLKKKAAAGTMNPVPLVVFESTVYPGLTEELCGSEIARLSGLPHGKAFRLGYSPERINPGDKVHRLETITKVISAEDPADLARLETAYGAVIEAGLHKAPSMRVAECAKVLENTQRDINIALMNELAIICEKMDIRTADVLAAAGTKWNFLPFTPGLVGGHCIGVDPYYLTAKAEELGYHPQVILSGRRINDGMPGFIAQKVMKMIVKRGAAKTDLKIGILGLAFKENVRDLRNSRVPEIMKELESFGVKVLIFDPVADPAHARHEYGITLCERDALKDLNAIILAVPHKAITDDLKGILESVVTGGIVADIKSAIAPSSLPKSVHYWSL